MNFFARRRMKSMLGSCDYRLAAEVLKQKFGDSESQTGLAQLIDEYIANPCFETAIPLIENDSLFTYYFTESKPGGLYARQNGKKEAAAAFQTDVDSAIDRTAGPSVEPAAGKVHRKAQKALRKAAKSAAEAPSGVSAEAVSEAASATAPGGAAATAAALASDTEAALVSDTAAALAAEIAAEIAATTAASAEPAVETFASVEVKTPNSAGSMPRGSGFANVISTLQIDIEELQMQVRRLEMKVAAAPRNHPERIKYQEWLAVYKEGISEFREAVQLLRQQRGK